MRKKPNLGQRMEKCARLLVTEPEALRGRWLTTRWLAEVAPKLPLATAAENGRVG